MNAAHPLADTVQVLAFDIFGTVVDWHGSIVREMAALHPGVDGFFKQKTAYEITR